MESTTEQESLHEDLISFFEEKNHKHDSALYELAIGLRYSDSQIVIAIEGLQYNPKLN